MSDLEETLEGQMVAAKFPPFEREYRFHPVRRWRFDFAFLDQLLAVEVEGATFAQGRHTRGAGFEGDCVKYGTAAGHGWRLVRVTKKLIDDGRALEMIDRALRWTPESSELPEAA